VPHHAYRLVLDTNVVVRGFINLNSISGRIITRCQMRRIIPLLSSAVLEEYRQVLTHPALLERYPELRRQDIDLRQKNSLGDIGRFSTDDRHGFVNHAANY
jgi:putative PIN family toxin of toxin-antitoxin system